MDAVEVSTFYTIALGLDWRDFKIFALVHVCKFRVSVHCHS